MPYVKGQPFVASTSQGLPEASAKVEEIFAKLKMKEKEKRQKDI